MVPSNPQAPAFEADDRFPSGPWTGFFLQASHPGRNWMELNLTFRDGRVEGEGRDRVGPFRIVGRYTLEDGKCRWAKSYIGQHTITYQGYNEGRGIWGTWSYQPGWTGGFHVWPVGMPDPTARRLKESVDEPASTPIDWVPEPADAEPVGVGEPVGAELGTAVVEIRGVCTGESSGV